MCMDKLQKMVCVCLCFCCRGLCMRSFVGLSNGRFAAGTGAEPFCRSEAQTGLGWPAQCCISRKASVLGHAETHWGLHTVLRERVHLRAWTHSQHPWPHLKQQCILLCSLQLACFIIFYLAIYLFGRLFFYLAIYLLIYLTINIFFFFYVYFFTLLFIQLII